MKILSLIAGAILAWPLVVAPLSAAAPVAPRDEGLLFDSMSSIVGASRFEQPVDEAPSSISVVTAEDIRVHGWRTLEEIIDNVRGFTVSQDRNYGTLGVRGFARGGDYNSRILLLLDGQRVNGNVYGEADYGRGGLVDTGIIDRVEVIRGPSSSIYGTGAFFAVINVITKRGREIQGLRLEAEAASYRGSELQLRTGRRLDTGLEYIVSASGFGDQGQSSLYFPAFDTPANGNGIARNLDGERARRLYGKLRYGDFTLALAWSQRDKVVPTAAYSTVFGDGGFRSHDERAMLDLRYEKLFSGGTQLQLRTSLNAMEFRSTYPFSFPPVGLNRDRGVGQWWTADASITTPLGESHRLTSGIEYQSNNKILQTNHDTVQRLYDERHNAQTGLFIQDEWRITSGLILNAGVRHDIYTIFGGTTNPRLGLVYRINPRHVVKLLAGRAFRAPNAYELYYADGTLYGANNMLRPERINSRELVLESELTPQLRLTGNLYQNHISNFIQQITDPGTGLLTFVNLGALRTHGWEAEMRWKAASGMDLRVAYSRQATRDAITGARVAGSPQWTSKLGLSVPLGDRQWNIAADARLISSRPTLAGGRLPTTGVADLNLRYMPAELPRLTVSSGILNLFDRQYADPGGSEHLQDSLARNGRTWRVQIELRFQ